MEKWLLLYIYSRQLNHIISFDFVDLKGIKCCKTSLNIWDGVVDITSTPSLEKGKVAYMGSGTNYSEYGIPLSLTLLSLFV